MTAVMRNARAAQGFLEEQTSGGADGKQDGVGQCADGWAFEIGVCVTHVDQPLPSLVKWRTRAGPQGGPLELYGLRSFLYGDMNPDRLVIAESLRRAVSGSTDCKGCALRGTGRCGGLPRAA